MKTVHRDVVSGIILSKDNKMLMGRKDPSKGGVYIEYWHIPGGGMEKGEDKIDALKREIFEEVGIDISKYAATMVDDIGKDSFERTDKKTGEICTLDMNFYVYEVKINDRNSEEIVLALKDDLYECKWFSIEELSSVKLTPPSVKLFKRLGYIN